MKYNSNDTMLVSVPLRGFCFSTMSMIFNVCAACKVSFRPLTGILFFNITMIGYILGSNRITFPSPYGDFVFQLFFNDFHCFIFLVLFPSPYGDFVFQLEKIDDDNFKINKGFRPLTGILFFNRS